MPISVEAAYFVREDLLVSPYFSNTWSPVEIAFHFRLFFKMSRSGRVVLNPNNLEGDVDLTPLFDEARENAAHYREKVMEAQQRILRGKDPKLTYTIAVQDTHERPADYLRTVWHFTGSAQMGKVVETDDFGVMGTRGLAVVDNSAALVPADCGAMAMAYLTGHLAAASML